MQMLKGPKGVLEAQICPPGCRGTSSKCDLVLTKFSDWILLAKLATASKQQRNKKKKSRKKTCGENGFPTWKDKNEGREEGDKKPGYN
jgi:hypothetical protein